MLVVGAGINGAVSAAALAGRGASVALIDRGDFGGFTSQESSNLVWGGFKYLENYELPLVFGLCRSRNRLMKAYPDNIKEISFLATLDRTAPYRPWFAAVGATAYWGIGAFGTHRPRVFDVEQLEEVEPVIDTSTARGAVQYQDAYLVDNDSRFVFSFVRSAVEAGAAVANYVELVSAERVGDRWECRLRDTDSGVEVTTSARVVVNAVGPFVDELNRSWGLHDRGTASSTPRASTSSSPGSRRPATTGCSPSSTTPDRLFYVIPMGQRSVIGTTDTRIETPFTHVTDEDRDFLLGQINARLDLPRPLTADDVIAERSGVRPLVVRAEGGDHQDADWTSPEPQARDRARHRPGRRHRLRRQAHRLPQRRRGGRRPRRGTRHPAREGPAQLVRRAGQGDPQGVLPPGPADAPRRAADPARGRAAERPALATLRPPRLRPARDGARRPDDGRGRHGLHRLPARRALHRRRARDDRDPRRLHAAPQQDRPRGAATATSSTRPGCGRSPRSCSVRMPRRASPTYVESKSRDLGRQPLARARRPDSDPHSRARADTEAAARG